MAKVQHLAHGVHPNLSAGLALFVVDLFIGFFTQRPPSDQRFGLGHQYPEVCMDPNTNTVATGALATSTLRRRGLTQPALG